MNLNDVENTNVNKHVDHLRFLNIPTINRIFDMAYGKETKIYLNILSYPAEGSTKSHVGRPNTLKDEWNTRTHMRLGLTLKLNMTDMEADVILNKKNLNNEEFNEYDPVGISILDEFNHSIDKTKSSTEKDHKSLFESIKKDYDEGNFNQTDFNKTYIKDFLFPQIDPNNKKKEENKLCIIIC